jgi:hypothetical protein
MVERTAQLHRLGAGDSDREEQGGGNPAANRWQRGGTLVRPAARSGS